MRLVDWLWWETPVTSKFFHCFFSYQSAWWISQQLFWGSFDEVQLSLACWFATTEPVHCVLGLLSFPIEVLTEKHYRRLPRKIFPATPTCDDRNPISYPIWSTFVYFIQYCQHLTSIKDATSLARSLPPVFFWLVSVMLNHAMRETSRD